MKCMVRCDKPFTCTCFYFVAWKVVSSCSYFIMVLATEHKQRYGMVGV